MKRNEFKEKLFEALNNIVDDMNYDEKMTLVHSLLVDYEKEMRNKEIFLTKEKNGRMRS